MKDRTLYIKVGFICLLILFSNNFVIFAQEENEDKDKITDLPPVKIEIVDTTQINIPREKFRSFIEPDPKIYTPSVSKERPWYLPNTSIPDKVGDKKAKAEDDLLLLLSAQIGAPVAFSYQVLLVKGFGDFVVLADAGRNTLKTGRTPNMQGESNADNLKGAFSYRGDIANLRTDVKYNARDIDYRNENGESLINDRGLTNLFANLDLKFDEINSISLGMDLLSLKMEGPLSYGNESGFNLATDFKLNTSMPETNPIEMGAGFEYFNGINDINEFREAIVKFHIRDNDVRLWYFVLGVGAELWLELKKDIGFDEEGLEVSDGWKFDGYPNPYLLITSRIGNRTVLQFGVERYILKQNLKDLYIDKDSVRFNPSLGNERTWDMNASLQYRVAGTFLGTIKAFDKEIRNLNVFEKSNEEILSWQTNSWDSIRISGIASEVELTLLEGKLKQNLQYIYESHDVKIPYRPKNKGNIVLTYLAPYDIEPSIAVEFYSRRYVGSDSDESLSNYTLWKPKISKAFGKYASAFISAGIYSGKDKYQVWNDYELPSFIMDFGASLRF